MRVPNQKDRCELAQTRRRGSRCNRLHQANRVGLSDFGVFTDRPETLTNGFFVNLFDMMKLALETDSTRIISVFINTTVIHQLTHHGGRPDVIAELKGHEAGQFSALNEFLNGLSSVRENGQPLLDRTMVLYGTNMGSANSHSNYNLPVILAGGGFRHGQHLAFDKKNNHPLSNLYLSMLQRLGIEADSFSTSTGTMRRLEMV